jgi:hypothetical protein
MPIVLVLTLVAGGLVLLAYLAHRAALWAEAKGWVYYQKKPRFRGSTLGFLEEIYNPSMHHVVEERDSERGSASQEESGDDPEPGDHRDRLLG